MSRHTELFHWAAGSAKARLLESGSSTDRGASGVRHCIGKVIAVEIAARATLPIKYKFILVSGWWRMGLDESDFEQ
jgi:hypothetical protein